MKQLLLIVLLSGWLVRVRCDNNLINNEIEDSAENAVIEISTQKSTTTSTTAATVTKVAIKAVAPPSLICPTQDKIPILSIPCKLSNDCNFLGAGFFCCFNRCVKGVLPPKPDIHHDPIIFGLVERVCSKEPIPEFGEVKECSTDKDCSNRICCPEKLKNGDMKGYCRTAQPVWDKVLVARPFIEPIKSVVSYMQCTPPPPPLLDLFPKTCNNPLDCFPNLCCQERGKRFCRPPKRSLLALVADLGQKIIPTTVARQFIEKIT